jgi:hypothetical protein
MKTRRTQRFRRATTGWGERVFCETNPCARRASSKFVVQDFGPPEIGDPAETLESSMFMRIVPNEPTSFGEPLRNAEHFSARSYILRSNAPRSARITKRTHSHPTLSRSTGTEETLQARGTCPSNFTKRTHLCALLTHSRFRRRWCFRGSVLQRGRWSVAQLVLPVVQRVRAGKKGAAFRASVFPNSFLLKKSPSVNWAALIWTL